MPLRPYQEKTLADLYAWLESNAGNPCIVLPTGSGKSWVLAEFCKRAIQEFPRTKMLVLSHVKEILEQDLEKMFLVWPWAPIGIYSAGIGRKEIDQITFASIQSIRKRAKQLGHIDLIIVDECHLISHKNEGSYRLLIDQLKLINPDLRVVGLTASPYRLGHGLITNGSALFDGLIEPVTIEELIKGEYLAPLSSKATTKKIDVSGVGKRGGEYIESELQGKVNTYDNNITVVSETIQIAKNNNRKSWLFFCTGIDHAETIHAILLDSGVSAACITSKTSRHDRESIIDQFKSGEIQALTNANVLTTGFDHPPLDLIIFLRPTLSPVLYVQMGGRGMRTAPGKDNCLVLDFAGNVARHGPITCVEPPRKKGIKPGQAPTKVCPQCSEIVHAALRTCPCGFKFPEPEKDPYNLSDEDIMGGARPVDITAWKWFEYKSKRSGKYMLRVSYYPGLYKTPIVEYFAVTHDGYAGQKAISSLMKIAQNAGVSLDETTTLFAVAREMSHGKPPKGIVYKLDGKYKRIIRRIWK